MTPEKAGEIFRTDMETLVSRTEPVEEQKMFLLRERALFFARKIREDAKNDPAGAFYRLFPEMRGDVGKSAEASDPGKELYGEELRFLRTARSLGERAAFCRFLSRELGYDLFTAYPPLRGKKQKTGCRVCYVRSAVTEEVMLRVSGYVPDAVASYASSAAEACAAVAAGDADYVILPWENAGERLPSMVRLAEKHELRTAALFRRDPEDETEGCCALLSRTVMPFVRTADPNADIRVPCSSAENGVQLCGACGLFSLRCDRVSVLPTDYGRFVLRFTLGGSGDMVGYFLFLAISSPGFSVSGIYPVL